MYKMIILTFLMMKNRHMWTEKINTTIAITIYKMIIMLVVICYDSFTKFIYCK